MNEAVIQALIRGVRVFLVAGLTALGADAGGIVDIGTQGNDITNPLVLAVVIAVIDALLKVIGGATQQVDTASRGRTLTSIERPNVLAV